MLGKANEIKFDSVQNFCGAYVKSESIDLLLTKWKGNHPNAEIIEIQYRTYSAGDAEQGMSWGETALIIYKEGDAS